MSWWEVRILVDWTVWPSDWLNEMTDGRHIHVAPYFSLLSLLRSHDGVLSPLDADDGHVDHAIKTLRDKWNAP